ncbi:hypothetical protein ANRL1_00851 [Anaerolineae bacterium]|nr:hypothetical protein ANRL1_00851 [Anaerolineae bacterium]
MKINVLVTPDGQISFAIAEGDFDAAKAALTQAINGLKLEGVDITDPGEIERHRHDDEHAHLHEHAHN